MAVPAYVPVPGPMVDAPEPCPRRLSIVPDAPATRRGRAGVAVALLFVLVGVGGAAGQRLLDRAPAVPPRQVVVEPGDTVWGLAERHGSPRRDLRETVDSIRRVNNLRGDLILPGQVIDVP